MAPRPPAFCKRTPETAPRSGDSTEPLPLGASTVLEGGVLSVRGDSGADPIDALYSTAGIDVDRRIHGFSVGTALPSQRSAALADAWRSRRTPRIRPAAWAGPGAPDTPGRVGGRR